MGLARAKSVVQLAAVRLCLLRMGGEEAGKEVARGLRKVKQTASDCGSADRPKQV